MPADLRVDDHPAQGAAVTAKLAQAKGQVAISPLVQMECLVGPMKAENQVLHRKYEEGLQQLTILPSPEVAFIQAAKLRARHDLKTPDALHLAAAQYHRCHSLWTHDDGLAHAAHGLALNALA